MKSKNTKQPSNKAWKSVKKKEKKKRRYATVNSSVEKGAEVTHAVASELVSLNGDKDLVVHQVLDGSAAGRLLVSAQLTNKSPLTAGGGGCVTVRTAAALR